MKRAQHCYRLSNRLLKCQQWSLPLFPSASNLFLRILPHVGNGTIIPWVVPDKYPGVILDVPIFTFVLPHPIHVLFISVYTSNNMFPISLFFFIPTIILQSMSPSSISWIFAIIWLVHLPPLLSQYNLFS